MITEEVPFKGRDGYQVAIAVTRKNERPLIPENCPSSMTTFLNHCWARDEWVRPTFPQIVRKLAQGSVFFPGGQPAPITDFFRKLPLSPEELRDMATPTSEWSRDFETAIPDIPNFNLAALAARDGECSPIDRRNEPLNQRQVTLQPSEFVLDVEPPLPFPEVRFSDPPAVVRQPPMSIAARRGTAPPNAPAPHSLAPTRIHENVFVKAVANRPAPPMSIFNAKLTTASNVANPFLEGVQAAPVKVAQPLRKRSTFEQFLLNKLMDIQVSEAEAFFTQTAEHFRIEAANGFREVILGPFSVFLGKKPEFLEAFVGSGFFGGLDFSLDGAFEANIRILIAVARFRPALITIQILRAVLNFASDSKNALKLLKLFAALVPHIQDHPDPSAIIRLFVDNSQHFGIDKFASIFNNLYDNPVAASHKPALIQILAAGLLSPNESFARMCFRTLCRVGCTLKDLPLVDILPLLLNGLYHQEALELLARLDHLPASNRLLTALLHVGSQCPLTVVCLCRLASDLAGARVLIGTPTWMSVGSLSLQDAIRVCLAVGQHEEIRKGLTGVAGFPAFLSWIAADGTDSDIRLLAPIMRGLECTEAFIRAVDGAGFFAGLLGGCQRPMAVEIALIVIDRFARVAWADGYMEVVKRMPGMFGNDPRIGQMAMTTGIVLSRYPLAGRAMLDLKMADVVKGCEIPPAFERYRAPFLQFLAGG
jgi:hypothetical protein